MARLAVGATAVALLLACSGSDPTSLRLRSRPIVQQTLFAQARPHLAKVAVAPFDSSMSAPIRPAPGDVDPREASERVARFFSEALAGQGIDVVPPGDTGLVLLNLGVDSAQADLGASAEAVAKELGATGLIVGTVSRYRDREGGAVAAAQPASVGFQVTLYGAPGRRKIWTGRFSHTQQMMGENLLEAGRLPGGGMRWLSAAELARWGADHAAAALVSKP